MTLAEGAAPTVGLGRSSNNVFLRPLSFPEPQATDLSHFVDPDKDVPIFCMIPTCPEVFEGTSKPRDGLDTGADDNADHSEASVDSQVKSDDSNLHFGPKDSWLRHLLLSHKIVIDKVSEISSIRR